MANIEVPLTFTTRPGDQPRGVSLVAVVNPDGSPMAGGSSGGPAGEQVTGEVRLNASAMAEGTKTLTTLGEFGQSIVEVALWDPSGPATTLKQPVTNAELRASAVPVSGPLTNAQLAAITGAANATMWDGLTPSATMISILKAMHGQNEALKRIGNETNTLLVQVAEHTRQIAFNTQAPET